MAAVPQRPPNRRLPAGDQSDPPPPTLPPRPGGRGLRPVPKAPASDESDDGSNTDPEDYVQPTNKKDVSSEDNPEEMYDDFSEERPPPLPPHPSYTSPVAEPELIYDDCNEEQEEQEIYDDCNEDISIQRESPGPIVVGIKNPVRTLPPPPPPEPTSKTKEMFDEVYEDPDASQESVYELDLDERGPQVPPISSSTEGDSVYEVEDHEVSSSLPPPLVPPKDHKRSEQRLPPTQSAPAPVGLPAGPGLIIDPNQLQGLKKNLRKVSGDDKPPEKTASDPKVYGECPQSVLEVKRRLEEKADRKPGISPKPAPLPIKAKGSNSNNSTIPDGSSGMNTRSPHAVGPQSTPDVTFLQKPNKNKHTNVPLPPVPLPHAQPKIKIELNSNSEDVTPAEPEEIYDDATSGDLLDKYEWFHGSIDRSRGESRVKSVDKDGTYLVRVSEKDPMFPYTLVVLHKGHVNNLRIRKRQKDGKFALGDEKNDELAFTDVPAMISHHKNHSVVLLGSNQSQVKLQQTPPKG